MRRIVGLILSLLSGTVSSIAGECPGNLNAPGTSRVVVVDPVEHPRVGTLQYREMLPLDDHEVVLSFDDGPLPPYTTRILGLGRTETIERYLESQGLMNWSADVYHCRLLVDHFSVDARLYRALGADEHVASDG